MLVGHTRVGKTFFGPKFHYMLNIFWWLKVGLAENKNEVFGVCWALIVV